MRIDGVFVKGHARYQQDLNALKIPCLNQKLGNICHMTAELSTLLKRLGSSHYNAKPHMAKIVKDKFGWAPSPN